MKLSYFRMYWKTLTGTAFAHLPLIIRSHTDERILWEGTVEDFAYKRNQLKDEEKWTVVSFNHTAYNDSEKHQPVYNRPIEIEVI